MLACLQIYGGMSLILTAGDRKRSSHLYSLASKLCFFSPKPTTKMAEEEKTAEKEVKAPNLIERAKEEIEAVIHTEKAHHKETHGLRIDIDENTPIDQVKAPSVFGRAKEEIEALVETIHQKKEDGHKKPDKGEGGFWSNLGKLLQNFCSPGSGKKD